MSALVAGPWAGTHACFWSHPCELPHVAGPAALVPKVGMCSALYRLGQRPPAGPLVWLPLSKIEPRRPPSLFQ